MIKHEVTYYEAFDVKPDGYGLTVIKTPLGKFVDAFDARSVAEGKGLREGENGLIEKGITNITVYENLTEYEEDMQANLKAQALSKLTAEEKALLGL